MLYRVDLLRHLPLRSVGVMVNPISVGWLKAVLYCVHPQLLYLISTWRKTPRGLMKVAHLVSAESLAGEARIVCAEPMDAAGAFAWESLDWVYIGCMPDAETLDRTLWVWAERVKPGGMVLAKMTPELKPAWEEYCRVEGIKEEWRAEGRRSMYAFRRKVGDEA